MEDQKSVSGSRSPVSFLFITAQLSSALQLHFEFFTAAYKLVSLSDDPELFVLFRRILQTVLFLAAILESQNSCITCFVQKLGSSSEHVQEL